MAKRVKGYHYAKRSDGSKYRVYTRGNYTKTAKGAVHKRRSGRASRGRSFGNYRLRGGGKGSFNQPKINNSGGMVTISHEEYLGDIVSAAAFVNESFALNPGLPISQGGFAAWLPAIASQFEQWKPIQMQFVFKSTSSDAVLSTAANSALGTISMATDYNVLNPPFANKVQMENYEFSKSTKPSQNMTHHVQCKRKQTPVSELYIRTGAVPAGADQRLYDLGLFQIAASGQQVYNGDLGELWVKYTIALLKPRILSGIGGVNEGAVNFDHIQIYNAGKTTTGVLPATPFGTSTTVPLYPTSDSTLGGTVSGGIVTAASFTTQPSPTLQNFNGGIPTLVNGIPTGQLGNATANTYYFPPGVASGNYMVFYAALWGVTGIAAAMVPTLSNCALVNLMNADASSTFNNLSSANTTTTNTTFFVNITKANASFSMVGSAGATTPTWAELFILQVPSPVN
jgi:hypothetical protein